MIHLFEILEESELGQMIAQGYVRQQHHPRIPLTILNYTAAAQYDRVWNDTTRQCRGLIFNPDTYEVQARPWPKFHNLGEHEEGEFNLDESCIVTDKMDGSLGILYYDTDGEPSIATRGSFTSEQALEATRILREKYARPSFVPQRRMTYLFEIIYPENRIVVNYGDTRDLVLLDVRDTVTGRSTELSCGWPGPHVDMSPVQSLREALSLAPRPNAEGLVVRYEDGRMLKIKQEDYVELHRLVTGLNERSVWEHLAGDGTIENLAERLPDEFHPWVRDVGRQLLEKFYSRMKEAIKMHDEIMKLPGTQDRKTYAHHATRSGNLTPLLFMLLDGKDIQDAVWKQLRPGVTNTLKTISEDTA